MSLIQRFTRDVASKYIWAALALAAAIGLAYSIFSGGRVLDEERANAEDRAVGYVEEVLAPRLDDRELAAPITGQSGDSLEAVVRRSILADERVSRVRIWSTEGTLLFSTDRADRPGSNEGLNDPLLREASGEGAITRWNYSDGGGADDPERSLVRTYVPFGGSAVAEIDQTDEGTVALARSKWVGYRFLAGGVLLLFLVMIALSLRDPIERMNVGVPFAASSVPRGFSLIDDDRLAAVHEVYRLASERVARLQDKLEESEGARRRLEGDIQRVLSKAGSSVPHPVAPAASAAPVTVVPEPEVLQVPESDVVVTSPLGDAWAAAPAGPLARASRAQKPAPTASLREKPAVEKSKRSSKRIKAKSEKRNAPLPQVAKPRPAPQPESRVIAAATPAPAVAPGPPVIAPPAATPAAARPAASAPAHAPAKAPAPVTAPRPAAEPITPSSEVDDAKAHAAALETFIRLTESDRQHRDMSTVDQGEIRAALARTAARKKPGGDRLQPHEGSHEESLGGPPKGKE